MTALFSIHTTNAHQHHHHHGFYYCFKYSSRRGIICESSFSLVFDSSSFFSLSLSLSLSARANVSRPCEQIIYSAFLSISKKMYYHTQAQQQPQQQRTKVVSRASAPPTCSLSMRPAHAQTAITDDANADVGCDSKNRNGQNQVRASGKKRQVDLVQRLPETWVKERDLRSRNIGNTRVITTITTTTSTTNNSSMTISRLFNASRVSRTSRPNRRTENQPVSKPKRTRRFDNVSVRLTRTFLKWRNL